MTNQRRTLIYTNEVLASQMFRDLNFFKPLLADMKKAYEKLEIGAFTGKVMETITQKGTRTIESDYNKHLEKQLDKAGITTTTIREKMLNGSDYTLQKFVVSYQQARNFRPSINSINARETLPFGLISYDEVKGVFFIGKKNREHIIENFCRVYLEGKDEKALYNSLVDFKKSYEGILAASEAIGLQYEGHGHGRPQLNDVMRGFFTWNGQEMEILPGSVKAAIRWTETAKRLQDERTKRAGTLGATGRDNASLNDSMSEVFKSLDLQ